VGVVRLKLMGSAKMVLGRMQPVALPSDTAAKKRKHLRRDIERKWRKEAIPFKKLGRAGARLGKNRGARQQNREVR